MATAATDASGYFPALYARVTQRIATSIADGLFEDGPRMDNFASTFAALYVQAAQHPADRPKCWRACWNVAADRRLLIVQHLLLGINAHVNHDLAIAVVKVGRATGGDLQSVRADFDHVNDVLGEVYNDVIGDLERVSRWTGEAVHLGAGSVFNFSLHVARRRAWTAAEDLWPLDAAETKAYTAELDEMVSVLALMITRPPLLARPLLWVARTLENHDPVEVTRALLGPAT